MKIEQILVQYLYDTKRLTLQGLGSFYMAENFVMPAENDKDPVIPDNAITFEYNTKTEEDEELIAHIVKQTGKITPLASADLDSYIMLGKQFLNIGKPFRIEGVGTLQKNMTGTYDFTPGQFITPKLTDIPRQLKEKQDSDISFETSTNEKSGANTKKIIIGAGIIVVLGLATWATMYFLNREKSADTETVAQQPTTPAKDTPTVTKDTNTVPAIKPDSNKLLTAAVTAPTNGYTFKIVIKNYPNQQIAEQKLKKLTGYGHTLLMYTKDSVTYKVAMPFTSPLSDTARAKDSVRKKLFGGNPYVEIN